MKWKTPVRPELKHFKLVLYLLISFDTFLSEVVHCWILFFIICTTYKVFMTEASSFPWETTFARFDNFKGLFWQNTLVPKLKSSLISLAGFRCSLRMLSALSIRHNTFESSVFLVLTCVVFKYSSWTFLNIKYSSRNGRIPVINKLLCRTSSVRSAGQLLFKNLHIFWAPNEVMVAEIFVVLISYKSGIFWAWVTFFLMEISCETLDAVSGANCSEKNPFPKFKGPFPELVKPSLLDLPVEYQQ